MSTVKTAVSLDEPLLDRIDALARELETSRSRVVALAAEEFVTKHENRRLLAAIDAALGEPEDPATIEVRRRMRQRQRERVKGTW